VEQKDLQFLIVKFGHVLDNIYGLSEQITLHFYVLEINFN